MIALSQFINKCKWFKYCNIRSKSRIQLYYMKKETPKTERLNGIYKNNSLCSTVSNKSGNNLNVPHGYYDTL